MRYFLAVIFLIHFSVFADQQYKTHRVSSGETVESIAEEYGVPATEIYKLNPDAKKGISRGTTLIIPPKTIISQEPEGSFTVHKVRKKETLYSLSKEYNVSIEEIKRYNKFLYAEPLKKGTKLRIPKRPKLSQTSPAITQEEAPSEENIFREHIVLPKETKYGISKKYGLTVEQLKQLNGLDDNSLNAGQKLRICLSKLRKGKYITMIF